MKAQATQTSAGQNNTGSMATPRKTSNGIINSSLLGFILRRHRILFIVMMVCAAAYPAMMVGIWPLFIDDSLQEMMDQLAAAMPGFDTGTFAMSIGEYLDTQWLGVYWLPLAGAVMIAVAAKGIAGSVVDGTLETIASYPIARTTYITTLIVTLVIISAGLALATILPIALMGPLFDIELKMSTYTLLIVASWLILLVFGLFVMAVSSWTRGSSLSVGIAVAVIIVFIVLVVATPFVEALEVIQPINLLHWWGSAQIIDEGSAKVGLWIYLAVVGIPSLVASYIGFSRRDVA